MISRRHKNTTLVRLNSPLFAAINEDTTPVCGTGSDPDFSALEEFKFDENPNYWDFSCTSNNNSEDTDYSRSHAPGVLVSKDNCIEPGKINRISRSFHGKTLSGATSESIAPRRASDNPANYTSVCQQQSQLRKQTEPEKLRMAKHKIVTQLSQPNDSLVQKLEVRKTSLTNEAAKSMRFTTVKVDENAHAKSAGYGGLKLEASVRGSDSFHVNEQQQPQDHL